MRICVWNPSWKLMIVEELDARNSVYAVALSMNLGAIGLILVLSITLNLDCMDLVPLTLRPDCGIDSIP